MQEVKYTEEALKACEKKLRRLIVVCLYRTKQVKNNSSKENNLQDNRQVLLKATFVEFEKFKKLYAQKLMQKG